MRTSAPATDQLHSRPAAGNATDCHYEQIAARVLAAVYPNGHKNALRASELLGKARFLEGHQ
jgi:hypothetical protein